jgi:hypothetical protein
MHATTPALGWATPRTTDEETLDEICGGKPSANAGVGEADMLVPVAAAGTLLPLAPRSASVAADSSSFIGLFACGNGGTGGSAAAGDDDNEN